MSAPNVPDPSATHGAARPGGTARLDAEIRTLALPAFATLVAEPLLGALLVGRALCEAGTDAQKARLEDIVAGSTLAAGLAEGVAS